MNRNEYKLELKAINLSTLINMVLLYDWNRWKTVADADNLHHEQKKWFSKYYPIMYPSWSSKCFICYFIYLIGLANILKLLVK